MSFFFLLPVRGRGCCGTLCISPGSVKACHGGADTRRWAYPANGRVYIIKFTNPIQIPKRKSQGLNLKITK